MRVDVRPVSRLRGTDPVDVTAALGPVIEALCASDVDLSRLTVVCDWIQYRSSFREVADYRPVLGPGRAAAAPDAGDDQDPERDASPETALEMAIDLRRAGEADLRAVLGARQPQPHLAVQRAVLAGAVPVGAGDGARLRAGAARGGERRPQHRGRPRADPGDLQDLGRPGRQERAAPRALRDGTRGGQRPPGPDLAGRVRDAVPGAQP